MPKLAAILALFFAVLAGHCPQAAAQTYASGYTRYQRADFKGAERALTAALKTEPGKDARAKILKLLGICQYMLGDQAAAAATFKQALALKPELTIASSEVLDDGVIDFFKKQRPKPPPAPPPAANKDAPALAAGAAAATPSAAPPVGGGGRPIKMTLLRVETNAPGASVLIDGIIAGQANSLINVDPGTVEIEVQAPGYASKTQQVTIVKDKETTVSVPLAAAVAEEAQPKPKRAKAKAPDSSSAAAGDELFGDETPHPRPPPPPDPTAAFDRDTQAAGAGYGMNGQAYPAGQPPPGYDNAYPYPQGQGAAGQPPNDPYNPAYNPAYGNGAAPYADRTPKGRNAANTLLHMLPFGTGQVLNHDYLLGSGFLLAEGYALYYAYQCNSAATKTETQASALISNREAQGQDLTADDEAYIQKANAYISTQKQDSEYALIGFSALWVAGAVEAVMHERPDKKPKKKKAQGLGLVVPDQVDIGPVPGLPAGAALSTVTFSWNF